MGPTKRAISIRAVSKDGGRTWSEGQDSLFPNPNAAVDFLKLQSGRLFLVYNDSMNRRTPLTVALSPDIDQNLASPPKYRGGSRRFRLPQRLPGSRRQDPCRLHLGSPDRDQSRDPRRGLDRRAALRKARASGYRVGDHRSEEKIA